MVVLIMSGDMYPCGRHIAEHNDNKTDNRLLANFDDSREMSSGPDDLPDSNLLINLVIAVHVLRTTMFSF